jgi:tetraacyldisaccharide 4'-kinase
MPDYLWRRRDSFPQRLALAPLVPLECAWRAGAALHRASHERGWLTRARLPCAVVSVGNLAVGGSGKTPLVGWLARALAQRGRRVAILSRGVGGSRSAGVNVVSDGERVLCSAADVGDEPVWLASSAGVPVLAGRDRSALGRLAVERFGTDLALLDDGFQHHRLERDVDLVCIDAALGLGNGRVLPRGPLRESPRVLARASALVFTRALAGTPPADAQRLPAGVPCFRVAIAPLELREIGGGPPLALDALRGREVGMLAAIARPDRFDRALEQLGARVVARRIFPDHHAWAPAELRGLERGIEWMTTAKDAVKIEAGWLEGARMRVLAEAVAPEDSDALLDFVLARTGGRDGTA